jgi:hypothetical protein
MFRFTQHDSADEMNSKAVGASVCNLPMKQACAFEDKTEFQPTPDTTRWAPGLPKTSLAYKRNETGRKPARKEWPMQTEKDIASVCSRVRYGHDGDERASHHAPAQSNGDEW